MKPLSLKPKEIDIVVSCLEQCLIFWNDRIERNDFPEGFNESTTEALFNDLFITYIKFSGLQEEMSDELESEEIPLPDNVLKFPDGRND